MFVRGIHLTLVILGIGTVGLLHGGEVEEWFHFKEPGPGAYRVLLPVSRLARQALKPDWLAATTAEQPDRKIELGSRIALGVEADVNVADLLRGTSLIRDRVVTERISILQAPDALTAATEAQRLADLPGVWLSHPVRRFERRRTGAYARQPNDPYFQNQWNLESRGANGESLGADLNVREAWSISRGEGILVAVGDDGVELSHPDFAAPAAGQPHFNFEDGTTNANPGSSFDIHATAVAGLIAARGDNGVGMAGVAPRANLASWKLIRATEEQLMEMFQFQSNVVSVQNHSWVIGAGGQAGPSVVESIGLSNALAFGRAGKGIVMTRAGGNARTGGGDANDEGFVSDPRVIAVGAVRSTGRVASYSSPGTCLLVAAPSGDTGLPTLFTTDRQGAAGYNTITFTSDLANYAFDGTGFTGTSGSAPQIAGITALMLAANPNLTIRDVQQILALSARHHDFADRQVLTNAAGMIFSRNVGHGVPDAGEAVKLARLWINRPPAVELHFVATNEQAIPDQGTFARAIGAGVPAGLFSLRGRIAPTGNHPESGPGEGLRPNPATPPMPLVFVGRANEAITADLTGKAALIERGDSTFSEKLARVEAAGGRVALVFNHTNDSLVAMNLTQRTEVVSLFLGLTNGQALLAQAGTNADLRVQIALDGPAYTFAVTNRLIAEHVGVRLKTSHPFRADLRITLTSPAGTLSELQRFSEFANGAGPVDWTYYSTAHFFEPTAGDWIVRIVDEETGATGTVTHAELILHGVAITDTDNDGLDDAWELAAFGNLASGPRDDPDRDGHSNAREQIMGTQPAAVDAPFQLNLDLSLWNANLARVSWPGSSNFYYTVRAGFSPGNVTSTVSNVAGRFPVNELFLPFTETNRFFGVTANPAP